MGSRCNLKAVFRREGGEGGGGGGVIHLYMNIRDLKIRGRRRQ